ncbi:hypothetical protein [Rhabdothermincola salaria]|uniref:hypothetical protein n=1 Tax=Rhabdothermincola salaria TaxID=2903142 RepID=UPI001E4FD3E3|nr:hypothetical protein [Rhabdothermincola salaria]MCD9625231.1 hypothetical protein [Rhabdothermincola salaria]
MEHLRDAAAALTDRPILIDLNSCVLTDPHALADLANDRDDRVDSCFVSRRTTCRLLLDRAGIMLRFAVFHQLEDALQARTFANDGYGLGWRRDP